MGDREWGSRERSEPPLDPPLYGKYDDVHFVTHFHSIIT